MTRERLVVVSYPVDGEFTGITRAALDGAADVAFLDGLGGSERAALLQRAEVLLGWNLARELPPGILHTAQDLRFIQLLSAGADSVDFAQIPSQVVLAGNVGAYAGPMAEHVMAMVLALAKGLPRHHAELAAGEFRQEDFSQTLDGAVCAILGFGGIGKATARLMRAFGAHIHAVNSSGATSEPAEFTGTLADLNRVLADADVLVISLPLTKATRDLIGARELALMKPTAILINVARGAIVDEHALYQHLLANPGFSAGIDTWWAEPRGGQPFRSHEPFFSLPNVIGSPHNSGMVPGVLQGAARQAAGNVARYLRGEPPGGVMNRADYQP